MTEWVPHQGTRNIVHHLQVVYPRYQTGWLVGQRRPQNYFSSVWLVVRYVKTGPPRMLDVLFCQDLKSHN